MKRTISVILSLVMLLSVISSFPIGAFAEEEITQFNCLEHLMNLGLDMDRLEETIRDSVLNGNEYVDLTSFKIPASNKNADAIYNYYHTYMGDVAAFAGRYFYYYYSNGIIDNMRFVLDDVWRTKTSDYIDIKAEHAKLEAAANKLLDGIIGNSHLTDVEKALLVHDRLATYAEYDPGFHNDAPASKVYYLYSALVDRVCVCAGFSSAYMYLMNKLGIDTFSVNSVYLSHVWNIVMIDGKPYYVDVTYDEGIVGGVGHDNFLVSLNGLIKTGHCDKDKKTDYITSVNGIPINDNRYDNCFWKCSSSEFRLVNDKIYYVDNEAGTLKAVGDDTVLYSFCEENRWCSRISNYNDQLLFSDNQSIYRYDTNNGSISKTYTPNKSENKRVQDDDYIFEFRYENNTLYCYYTSYYDDEESNIERDLIKHSYYGEDIPQQSFTVTIDNDSAKGRVKGAGKYIEGTRITLQAESKSGYAFDGFYLNGNLLEGDSLNSVSVFVNDNMDIEARYSVCTHKFEEKIIKRPTCSGTGKKSFVCEKCSYVYYEDIPSVEHNYINGYCEYCDLKDVNYSISQISIPFNTSVKIAKAGTYYYASFVPAANGEITVYSSGVFDTYGYLYNEDMEILANDDNGNKNGDFCYSYSVIAGKKYIIACRMNNTDKIGSFDLTVDFKAVDHNHIYEESIIKLPTCSESGLTKYVCSVCGAEYNEAISEIGHCFENNLCKTCGAVREYDYTVQNGIATITKYNGTASSITLPARIDNYPINHIGEKTFIYNNSIERVVISEGYISVGDGAFYNCQSLKSVSLPDSLKTIGYMSFCWCKSLETIYIPENVESISNSAFNLCRGIRNASVDVNNEHYDSRINCNAIIDTAKNEIICGFEDTVIPHTVTSIATKSFAGNWAKTIRIPKSITHIGYFAFTYDAYNHSYDIHKLKINDSYISNDADDKIKTVYYEGSETDWNSVQIDPGNENLTEAAMHFNAASEKCEIHVYDFSTVTKEPTCKKEGIKKYTCSACGESYYEALPRISHRFTNGYCDFCGELDKEYSIPEITIPFEQNIRLVSSNVAYIASFTAKSSGRVTVYPKRNHYNNSIFIDLLDENRNYISGDEYNDELGARVLTFFAVEGNRYIIQIRDYVNSAGAIDLIIDYTNEERIHNYIENVQQAATCTESGRSEFVCSVCGDTQTEITYAYGHKFENNQCINCGAKEFEFTVDSENIATITAYNGNKENLTLPTKLEGYSVKYIGNSAFQDKNIINVTIPEGYISIADDGFLYCNKLRSISFPNTLKSIGWTAFFCCDSLKELYIPKNVETIEVNAFGACRSIKNVVVDENNRYLDSRNNCNAIIDTATNTLLCGFRTTVIPHNVTHIRRNAFFANFPEEITIPKSVKTIEREVFSGGYDSDKINDVYYTGSEEEWNAIDIDDYGHYNFRLTDANIHFNTPVIPCEIHFFGNAEVKQPTCTEQGYTSYTCSVCGEVNMYDYTDIIPHTPDTAVRENVIMATQASDGSFDEVVYCTVCGEELSRITKISHYFNWKPLASSDFSAIDKAVTNGSLGEVPTYNNMGNPISWSTVVWTSNGNAVKESDALYIPDGYLYISGYKANKNKGIPIMNMPNFKIDFAFRYKAATINGDYSSDRVTEDDVYTFMKIGANGEPLSNFSDDMFSNSTFTQDANGKAGAYNTIISNGSPSKRVATSSTNLQAGVDYHYIVEYTDEYATAYVTDNNGNVIQQEFYTTDSAILNEFAKGLSVAKYMKIGDSYNSNFLLALEYKNIVFYSTEESYCEHSYVQTVVEPSCTTQGSITYTCTECGNSYSESIAALGHNYVANVKAPTCTACGYTSYTCSRCNDTYVDEYTDIIAHSPSSAVRENVVEATYFDSGSYDEVVYCSACGLELSREAKTIPQLTHNHIAGETKRENEIAPTCSAEGSYIEIVYCSVCGEEISRETKTIEKLPHTPVVDAAIAATCTESGLTEGKHCSVCGEILVEQTVVTATGHNYVAKITAPSCTARGYTTYVCSRCNDTYVEDYTDITAHTPSSAVRENVVEATLYSSGFYDEVIYCSVCGQELSREEKIIPQLTHDHIAGETRRENEIAPTCSAEGSYVEIVYCSICGEEISRETKTVEKLPHTPVVDAAIAATCTESGLTEGKHCSVCGEIIEAQEIIAEFGHNYTSEVTEPTCTETGYTTHICTRCNDTCTDNEVDALGHSYVIDFIDAPNCTEGGCTYYYCTRCNDWYSDNITKPLGHNYEAKVIAPTCTENGYTLYSCTRCLKTYIDNFTENSGHNWNTGEITKKATPSATGLKLFTCNNCGATKTETIAKCAKYANPLKAKGKTVKVKYVKLKNKNQTVAQKKAFSIRKAQGKVTYKKSSGNKKITVAKNGKITVKKGLKKGTYKVKVKVTAAGNANYKSSTKAVTVTIKVK